MYYTPPWERPRVNRPYRTPETFRPDPIIRDPEVRRIVQRGLSRQNSIARTIADLRRYQYLANPRRNNGYESEESSSTNTTVDPESQISTEYNSKTENSSSDTETEEIIILHNKPHKRSSIRIISGEKKLQDGGA